MLVTFTPKTPEVSVEGVKFGGLLNNPILWEKGNLPDRGVNALRYWVEIFYGALS